VRFLLDTNTISDLARRPKGPVRSRIARVGDAAVCTSIIVAAEFRFGAAHKRSTRLTAQVEAILGSTHILPLEPPVDRVYAELRARLAAIGRPIGANDLLIAAHALTLGLTLVTANTREFARIEALPLENWLEAD
jgi:tRNA(fMet)-specific endonuclease VapC